MKTLFTLAVSFWILTLSATAQQKLWTWKIENTTGFRSVCAAAMNQDGSGAFVLTEFSSYLLVWVSAGGKVLLSQHFASGGGWPGYVPPETPWELSFSGPDKLLARYQKKVRLYDAREGKAKLVKVLSAEKTLIFGASTFGGWIAHKGKDFTIPGTPSSGTPGTPGYMPGIPSTVIESVDSVTAWRF